MFLADSAMPRAFNKAWDQDELPIERQGTKVKNPQRKGTKYDDNQIMYEEAENLRVARLNNQEAILKYLKFIFDVGEIQDDNKRITFEEAENL